MKGVRSVQGKRVKIIGADESPRRKLNARTGRTCDRSDPRSDRCSAGASPRLARLRHVAPCATRPGAVHPHRRRPCRSRVRRWRRCAGAGASGAHALEAQVAHGGDAQSDRDRRELSTTRGLLTRRLRRFCVRQTHRPPCAPFERAVYRVRIMNEIQARPWKPGEKLIG